jgi:hypothetical protein
MPPEALTVPLQQFYNEQASVGAMDEANRFRTVPTGSYTIQAKKAEGKVWPGNNGSQGTGDRNGARIQAEVLNEHGKKVGVVFFNVSWAERRTAKGYLDGPTKLYSNLAKALWPEKSASDLAALSPVTVIETALQYPVSAYITEKYRVPNPQSQYGFDNVTPRDDAEAATFRTAGYETVNNVLSISKMKTT